MTLLSYNELVVLAESGVITNVSRDSINASSIDIHLAPEILIEEPGMKRVDYRARQPLNMRRASPSEILLAPGDFILASSVEQFNLPPTISAQYRLKSSMARIGLEHLNAGHADAGWNGSVLTLELKNVTQYHTILLRPGDAIGQMVFFRHAAVPDDRSYAARGRYNNDRSVSSIKE